MRVTERRYFPGWHLPVLSTDDYCCTVMRAVALLSFPMGKTCYARRGALDFFCASPKERLLEKLESCPDRQSHRLGFDRLVGVYPHGRGTADSEKFLSSQHEGLNKSPETLH